MIALLHAAAALKGADHDLERLLSAALSKAVAAPPSMHGWGGLSTEQEEQLKTILIERGVHAEAVQERVGSS